MPTDVKWIETVLAHWPEFAWLIPIGFVAWWALKFLSAGSEVFAKWMGPLGDRMRKSAVRRRTARLGELEDLRAEVEALSQRVNDLRINDQIYWSYVMYDEEWHRKQAMAHLAQGRATEPHLTFLTFRDRWCAANKIEIKDEFWSE